MVQGPERGDVTGCLARVMDVQGEVQAWAATLVIVVAGLAMVTAMVWALDQAATGCMARVMGVRGRVQAWAGAQVTA